MTANAANDISLESLAMRYGDTTVLHRLNLRVEPGELVALLGPSGCGKTTTLRILAGFARATEGRVRVAGRDLTDVPANRRGIGMVFQAYSLFPNLDVSANIEYGLRLRQLPARERSRRVSEMLELTGLARLAKRRPHELSGGQQQRVALARAIAPEPKVLLLDEPLSALDASVRGQIRDEFRRLQRELKITTLFVTHDQSEALSIADRVAVMNEGVIEQIGEPAEVYQRPATRFVARFVGLINEIGVTPGGTPRHLDPYLPGPGRDTVFVRPENLALTPHVDGRYRVVSQLYTGERTMVRAETASDRPALVASVSAQEATALPVGTQVVPVTDAPPALVLAAVAEAEYTDISA